MIAAIAFVLPALVAFQKAPPQIDLTHVKSKAPAYAVAGFLKAWAKNDREGMTKYLQASSKREPEMLNGALGRFMETKIGGAKVGAAVPVPSMGDMLADVRATVWVRKGSGFAAQQWNFRVVREDGAGMPSASGVWGVNLASGAPIGK